MDLSFIERFLTALKSGKQDEIIKFIARKKVREKLVADLEKIVYAPRSIEVATTLQLLEALGNHLNCFLFAGAVVNNQGVEEIIRDGKGTRLTLYGLTHVLCDDDWVEELMDKREGDESADTLLGGDIPQSLADDDDDDDGEDWKKTCKKN